MRRRKMLAVLGSIGATTIAGCIGGDGGSSSGEGCVPETDDLSSLFPDEAEGFSLRNAAQSGLDIGTDTYVVARYNGPDGNPVGVVAARYESSSAARQGVDSIRSEATGEVVGTLVDGSIAIGVDAQSESTARALIRASEISDDCAGQLSFSSDGGETGTTTEPSFRVGDPIWGQRDGNAARTGVTDAEGVTSDELSSFTVGLPNETRVDYYLHYQPAFTENAFIYRGKIYDKSTGDVVREFPFTENTTPAVTDNRIFLISGGEVIAVDTGSYELAWRKTTVSNGKDLIVHGDRVFVSLGDAVTALSASDGSQVWRTSTEAARSEVRGLFAASGDSLYTATGLRGDVKLYSVSDGSQRWSLSNERDVRKEALSCVGPDGNLYVIAGDISTETSLFKFDASGNEVWRNREIFGKIYAVDNTRVYFGDDDSFGAIDKEDGSILWQNEQAQGTIAAAVASNAVYAATSNRLFVLNKQSGERIKLYSLGGDVAGYSMGVGGGVVSAAYSELNSHRMKIFY